MEKSLLRICPFGVWMSVIAQDIVTLSQAVCQANNNHKIETIFHLLDDFLTVDRPDDCADVWSMSLLGLIFRRHCIPLSLHNY